MHGPLIQLQSILNSFILFYPHSSVLKAGLELLIPPTGLITEKNTGKATCSTTNRVKVTEACEADLSPGFKGLPEEQVHE